MNNKTIAVRKYSPREYIECVENSDLPLLKQFMKDEREFIQEILAKGKKSVVDLGAGYGRIIPDLGGRIDSYFGVEINPEMYEELKKRVQGLDNYESALADFTNLRSIIDKRKNLLFLLLQNTIGTIEGELNSLLEEMKFVLKDGSSELVVAFFRSQKLETLGVEMFSGISEMVGEPDFEKCDFSHGIFRSVTGYEAKWWSDKEIRNIIQSIEMDIVSEFKKDAYVIYHLKRTENGK